MSPRGSPSTIDPSTRDLLLHAASVFAKYGYYETPTRKLKSRKFSEALFFKRFRSKAGILKSMFDLMWGEVLERSLAETEGVQSPVEKLQTYLRVYVSVFKDFEDVCKVVTRTSYPTDKSLPAQEKYHDRFQRLVLESMVELRQRDLLADPSIPLHFVYYALRGALQNILDQYHREKTVNRRGSPPFSIDDVERHIPILLNAFLRVPRAVVVDQLGRELSHLSKIVNTAGRHIVDLSEIGGRLEQVIDTTPANRQGGEKGSFGRKKAPSAKKQS